MTDAKTKAATPVKPAKPAQPAAPAAVAKPNPPSAKAVPASPQKGPVTMTEATKIKETMQKTAKEATDKAQAMIADMNDRAKGAVEKSQKMVQDVTEFQKGNVDALVESAKIAAKGAEEILRYSADYGRKAVETATTNAKTLASVKSPTELFQLQSDYAKSAFDDIVAESAKFTENYLKLLGAIAQPLSNRMAVAAEKVKLAA